MAFTGPRWSSRTLGADGLSAVAASVDITVAISTKPATDPVSSKLQALWLRFLSMAACCACLTGCSPSSPEPITSSSSNYEASDPSGESSETVEPISSGDALPVAKTEPSPPPSGDPTAPPATDGLPAVGQSGLQALASDASAEQAIDFIIKTNQEIQKLTSGQSAIISTEDQFREAKRISMLKLAAAENALQLDSLDEENATKLKRSKLEALSHLVGLQDVSAADKLEAYATELAGSDNPLLVNDSRVVRLGIEMDKLRSGLTKSTDGLLALVDQFNEVEGDLGMPAFYTFQNVFSVLSQYGYYDEALRVRNLIATKYAANADPQVAAIAKQMGEAAQFDGLDRLQRGMSSGDVAPITDWTAEIEKLLNASVDVASFQYLASLALSAEAADADAVADLAYAAIEKAHTTQEDDAELATEAAAFVKARESRAACIGKPLNLTYPDIAGAKIDWQAFRGKPVVMPFWSTEQRMSMMIIPVLEEMLQNNPGKFAVLGVNLDSSDEQLTSFRQQVNLSFPTIRNPDASTRGIKDPLAKQVGVATFPFLVIVDAEGNVQQLLMGPRADVRKTIETLISSN